MPERLPNIPRDNLQATPESIVFSHLVDDIKLLTELLNEVIKEQEGEEFLKLEEKVYLLAKKLHENYSQGLFSQLHGLIQGIDLGKIACLLKDFTAHFHLNNLAEKHYQAMLLKKKKPSPLQSAAEMLRKLSPEQIQKLFDQLSIELVFTAHPTESKRSSILEKLHTIDGYLSALDSKDILPEERSKLLSRLKATIILLRGTDEVRAHRPQVGQEVQYILGYFEEILWKVIPNVYNDLKEILACYYPDHCFTIPPFLRFASWVGGDRDGNPLVTTEVTKETLKQHRELAKNNYLISLRELLHQLSFSDRRTGPIADLEGFLSEYQDRYPELIKAVKERHPHEPYRQVLRLMSYRLGRRPFPKVKEFPQEYKDEQELLADLARLKNGLLGQGHKLIAEEFLFPLIRQVEVFSLHIASLDIRQHCEVHEEVVNELLGWAGIASDYRSLSLKEKSELLEKLLFEPEMPAFAESLGLSPQASETLSLFSLIAESKRKDPKSIGYYLISMARHPSDVLEVLWLSKIAGMFSPGEYSLLDIAPLFETITTLERCGKILSSLLDSPAYREHLRLRGDHQLVQLGYSDSTKDGGYLMANWLLYKAQHLLAKVAKSKGIELTIFHGRGGAIGRGGGPTHDAILSLPHEAVRGKIRLTEQGEVVADNFSNPIIARHYLEQIIDAVLRVSITADQQVEEEWAEIMEEMSTTAYEVYKKLVFETPGFLDYFFQATPIDIITELTIGSRPTWRLKKDFNSLRAIPWVFAWMQSRHTIPGWYGLGSALMEFAQKHPDGLKKLSLMYDGWFFFKTMINNAQMVLSKADINIASHYAGLVEDKELRQRVFAQIESEYQRTVQAILLLTGQKELLDNEPLLKWSIRERNPYIDPLNYIQVELLRQFRKLPPGEKREAVLDALRLSIAGIAAALKNTG